MSYPHHRYPHHYHDPPPSAGGREHQVDSSVRKETTNIITTTGLVLYLPLYVILTAMLLTAVTPVVKAATPSRKFTAEEYRLMMQDRALLNLNLMNTIGSCRDPRPLVIYPPSSPNKIFHPRGTLVHRCNDLTGCCLNPGEVCRPDHMQNFEKVFFVSVYVAGQRFGKAMPRFRAPKTNYTTSYETVAFMNHTSCRCVKLPPNSIEHDDTQSVVSRPLVHQLIEPYSSNSYTYYIVVSLGIIVGIIVLITLLKCMYINPAGRARRP